MKPRYTTLLLSFPLYSHSAGNVCNQNKKKNNNKKKKKKDKRNQPIDDERIQDFQTVFYIILKKNIQFVK